MKRIISSILFLVIFFSLSAQAVDSIIDIHDGQIYKVVKIGEHWWFAENLRSTHYANGDPITKIKDKWVGRTTEAYCWYRNDSIANAADYGALYNWYAVIDPRNICPAGWHVATDEDWKKMESYSGMCHDDLNMEDARGSLEAGKLKESGTLHWRHSNTDVTNEIGFTALPGGFRNDSRGDGEFLNINSVGYWWCAHDSVLWRIGIKMYNGILYPISVPKYPEIGCWRAIYSRSGTISRHYVHNNIGGLACMRSYGLTNHLNYGGSVRCVRD